MKYSRAFFFVASIALLTASTSAKATDWWGTTDIQFAATLSDEQAHETKKQAAIRAQQQLENVLGQLKYSDGTLEVKSIEIKEPNPGRIVILVTANKMEETKELSDKMPTVLHGVPVYLNYPASTKPVYGATFDVTGKKP
jgi:hypothetical protein